MEAQNKIIIGLIVLVGGYVAFRGFKGVAKDVGGALVSVPAEVASGFVVGMGQQFGIPVTKPTQCETDVKNRGYWDASFSCPAKRYAQFLLTGK